MDIHLMIDIYERCLIYAVGLTADPCIFSHFHLLICTGPIKRAKSRHSKDSILLATPVGRTTRSKKNMFYGEVLNWYQRDCTTKCLSIVRLVS
jgi:hypothetical protein